MDRISTEDTKFLETFRASFVLENLRANGTVVNNISIEDMERYKSALINIASVSAVTVEVTQQLREDAEFWQLLPNDLQSDLLTQPSIALAIEGRIEAGLEAEIAAIKIKNEELRKEIEYYQTEIIKNKY